jgi:hypothetical protein
MSFKDLFASDATLLKPAPGSQPGMYFTEQVGEYSSRYQGREIDQFDLQSGMKSTRYAPGSLNSEKRPTADSASAMIGSPCSCTS